MNRNVGLLSLENIERYGEYTSLRHDGRSYTNVRRDAYAGRLAAVLTDTGVSKDDIVVVMMPNSPEVTASFQALWKIGAVITPITPALTAREVRYLIENSGARAAVTTPPLAARLREAVDGLADFRHLLVIGETDVDGARNIENEIESASPVRTLADRSGEDLALLLYTSGTTGHPKGVMLTHENLLSNARGVAELNDVAHRTPVLHVLPLSHSFGVMTMNVGYVQGTTMILLARFEAARVVEAIQDYKVERMSVVPTMLTYLINFPQLSDFNVDSLNHVHSGGASLPNEVRVEFERLYGCGVKEGYGLSETSPTATGYRQEEPYRPGSVGRSIAEVQVCIMDDDNRRLAPGERGEICIQGPNIMRGYWKNEDATRQAMAGGWFHSGDIGIMDEDGFVFITDRKKDLIIKGGENISPREIEEAIHEHPSVAEVAVVALPDPIFGEEICAVVALKDGKSATEEEIKQQAATRVTKFKIPSQVLFVSDLPKNPTGKILKKVIRKQAAKLVS